MSAPHDWRYGHLICEHVAADKTIPVQHCGHRAVCLACAQERGGRLLWSQYTDSERLSTGLVLIRLSEQQGMFS